MFRLYFDFDFYKRFSEVMLGPRFCTRFKFYIEKTYNFITTFLNLAFVLHLYCQILWQVESNIVSTLYYFNMNSKIESSMQWGTKNNKGCSQFIFSWTKSCPFNCLMLIFPHFLILLNEKIYTSVYRTNHIIHIETISFKKLRRKLIEPFSIFYQRMHKFFRLKIENLYLKKCSTG